MPDESRKKLRRVTVVFWIFLLYIVAALLWWLVSLEQQNRIIHELKGGLALIQPDAQTRVQLLEEIRRSENRESTKYLAEGVTFLLLILVGAIYIYRLVRRQFKVQQQQQNFVMAVTHELKTPLSIARLNLETMQKHQLDEAIRKTMVAKSLDETIRLDSLINNILISSQLDSHRYKVSKDALDFSALIIDATEEFKRRHPQRQLFAEITPDLSITGDALLLKLLVSNLLENAHKYSEHSKPIKCLLKKDSRIRLCVIDEGAGIPDEEKKLVFDKFYRVGDEQVRKTKGTGLGLFICRKIALYHKAKITVTDNQPHGSTFTVSF